MLPQSGFVQQTNLAERLTLRFSRPQIWALCFTKQRYVLMRLKEFFFIIFFPVFCFGGDKRDISHIPSVKYGEEYKGDAKLVRVTDDHLPSRSEEEFIKEMIERNYKMLSDEKFKGLEGKYLTLRILIIADGSIICKVLKTDITEKEVIDSVIKEIVSKRFEKGYKSVAYKYRIEF